jgi:hypothetical protein
MASKEGADAQEVAGVDGVSGAAEGESLDTEFVRLIKIANRMNPLCESADRTTAELIALSKCYESAEEEFEVVEEKYTRLRGAVDHQTRRILDLAKEIVSKQAGASKSVVQGKFGAGNLMIAATQKGHAALTAMEHAVKVVATQQEIQTYRALKQIHPGKQLTKKEVEQLKQDVKEHGSTVVLARALNAKASEKKRRVAHHAMVEANEVRAPPLLLRAPRTAVAAAHARSLVARSDAGVVPCNNACVPPPHSLTRPPAPSLAAYARTRRPLWHWLPPPCRARKTAWTR